MVEFKVVINDAKTGKSYQKVIAEPNSKSLMGLKLGQTLKGEALDMTGYEFLITGGSDLAGFPMRKDLNGIGKKKLLLAKGKCMRNNRNGIRIRKTVCANTIYENITQISLKVTKYGKESLEPKTEETPAEEKAE